jgi:hypothetical protein
MIFGFAVFSALLLLMVAELFPKPAKSPEQELGDAIAKYLAKGVKVRPEKTDD